MKYMGSKARHVKEFLPIILEQHEEGTWYVEPFVGGANSFDAVPKGVKKLGADINQYLVAMWQAVSRGWMPPKIITETDYRDIQRNKEKYPAELVGYVGFALSYGGKWWGGWRRDSLGKRNYVDEALRNAEKQFPKLHGATFVHADVFSLDIPKNSTIYCDPPYAGTTSYKDTFNHLAFYDWCRDQKKNGCKVFISEYSMPDDFVCVWEKMVTSSLTKNTGGKSGIEKLFTLNERKGNDV